MARLLVLLACARGAAGIMDALDIKAVCEVPADGPRKIYLDMDAEAFETLAGHLQRAGGAAQRRCYRHSVRALGQAPVRPGQLRSDPRLVGRVQDLRRRHLRQHDLHVPPGCYGRDDVRVRRDDRRRVGRGVLRGRPGLLARHPVPRVLARPDAVAHPRVLRVQLSTPDPTMLARSPTCARYESRRRPHRLS